MKQDTKIDAMAAVPAMVGRYEILGLLGEGGMGRVYRARDTQLARAVAVKVLPPGFAADADSLRRFEQEARATAALNHPGIMAIYDVGVQDGAPYLVSELLEGTTLRARMETSRQPLAKVIDLAVQIADALSAAHVKGIVHRDLKPDNVFLCSHDRIKILDFGLAKLTAPDTAPGSIDATGTQLRAIVGTPGYMAPEQARGEPADHRADIFSFGCILYELISGQRPFAGKTAVDVIGAVLKDTPPRLTGSPDHPLPPALEHIVQRCLEKDPGERFQSASDLAFVLRHVSPSDSRQAHGAALLPASAKRRSGLAWAIAVGTVAGLGAVAALVAIAARRAPPPSAVEFLVPPPTETVSFAAMPLQGLLPTAPQVGVSPDGRSIAFVITDAAGLRSLWLRALDASRPRPIEGTEDVSSYPFWSPDSRYVVVAAKRALLKVDSRTGSIERLCALPNATPPVPFVTGSWGEDGTILFSVGGPSGLFRTDTLGQTPQPVTTLDPARADEYHSWPQLLPGGGFLFFVRTNAAETNGIYAGRLDSNETALVQASTARGAFAAGHLLWLIEERLVAQPFDPGEVKLTGQPVTLLPSVFQGAGRTPAFWTSSGDTVVFASGDTRERQFRSFTRSGTPLDVVGPPGLYVTFDATPDLSKVVVEVSKDSAARYSTLAVVEPSRGLLSPLTLGDQNDTDPRFDPDGTVAFARNSRENPGIMRIDPVSNRLSTLMPRGALPVIWLEDAASDGSVVYRSGANRDAWQRPAALPAEPQRLTNAREPIEQVQLSPDRRWIAYNTAETGRSEVFVASTAPGGERHQVSAAGAVQATWRADGKELYFLGLDAGLYSVAMTNGTGKGLQPGPPELMFRTPLPVISSVVEQYRPSSDGQRFLLCLPLTAVRREPLRMLLNWRQKLTDSQAGR